MSLTKLPDAKKYGDYEYIKEVAPVATDDSGSGFVVGDRWLDIVTGFSYEASVVAVGAAVWPRTQKVADNKIILNLPTIEQVVFEYLQNPFSLRRMAPYTGDYYGFWTREDRLLFLDTESVFSDYGFVALGGELNVQTKIYGLPINWKPGDIIRVAGSKRNNGFLTISTIDENTGNMTTVEDLKDEVSEGVFIFLASIPDAVISIIGKMAWYDTFIRPDIGLKSEKTGTYSFTVADQMVGSIGYPVEIVGDLDGFRGISIGGISYGPR